VTPENETVTVLPPSSTGPVLEMVAVGATLVTMIVAGPPEPPRLPHLTPSM
jgi:hypothetical protein